ncbi:phage terminase large subunit [Nitratireductor sp. GZWM139]|uniref:phage terminase large subunit n=1 Tax=Nitratireductor sp. GZWM139 TaxID=2950541 RepID=UPI0024BDA204|nr:phage terminase large subunit [Nitratireductor sp. GZWM139]MDJ1465666.1 phage terminase large subunit [Nitratireductor sp. GZWM139]
MEAIRAQRQTREANRTIDAEAEAAGVSLSAYIRGAWHVLEPGRAYRHGWHIDAISDHLGAVTNDQINRLIINVPPGTMKSLAVGVFWPTWEWGPLNKPHLRTLATSYKESLAKRDNIKARRLVQSDWFRDRWGQNFDLMPDQNSTLKFENDKSGFRAAMAFKSLTGERGDRVIIDDPLSVDQAKSDAERLNAQETFLEAVPNRLSDPEMSAIVLVMQRLHEGDTTGIALAKNLGYEHLMLPMEFEPDRCCYTAVKPSHMEAEPVEGRYDALKQVWYLEGSEVPEGRKEYVDKAETKTVYRQDRRTTEGELLFEERFPRTVVERDKVSLGSVGHAGQNQQRPAPRGGGLFKRSYFKPIKAIPAGTRFVRGWDLAATDDNPDAARTAGVKIGQMPDGRFVIAHCVAEHASPARVRTLIGNTADLDDANGERCRVSLPKDPGQAGKDQAQQLVAMLAGHVVSATPESGDKVTRAEPLAAQCEAGNVDILEGAWNDMFLDEVEVFPAGKLKDIVDAASRAFNDLVGRAAPKLQIGSY